MAVYRDHPCRAVDRRRALDVKPCAVFDLDGTLTDCRHRLHFVRGGVPDWEAFFVAGADDPPHAYAVRLAQLVARDLPVVIVSGRPERNRALTHTWLLKYDVPYVALILRADEDRRPDHEYKAEALAMIRSQGFEPLFAVDDRPSVVRFWREAEVPCLAADDEEWRVEQHHYDGHPETQGVDNYDSLRRVLDAAYDRAARGKGRERHAQDLPFTKQPILAIAGMTGAGGYAFQVMKKAQEALRLEPEAARKELLDIVVYAAAWYLLSER